MSNQDRVVATVKPSENQVRLCALVADQLLAELNPRKVSNPDKQDISDLLGALSFLEGYTARRLNKTVPLDHDDGEHGVNDHRRLAAIRARVNRRLESLAEGRG